MSKAKKSGADKAVVPENTAKSTVAQKLSPPALQESSFENLRQKIEGNLKKTDKKSAAKKERGSAKPVVEQRTQDEYARGKKRSRNGDVKEHKNGLQNAIKPKQPADLKTDDDAVDLKAIFAELGGTQEDIDLIDGVQSDSEVEGLESQPVQTGIGEPKKGKSLESGMVNILKEIALVRDTYQDSEAEDEDKVKDKVNGTTTSVRPEADDKSDRQRNDDSEIKFKSAATEVLNAKGKKPKLRCDPRPDWFSYRLPDIDLEQEPKFDISPRSLSQLHSYGRSLLHTENEMFKSTQMSSSSKAFYNTVIASGTLSDKVSALTLAAQESPLHNMRALEALLGLAQKRSRSQAVDVLRALKDLFAQGSLLPSDRKLYTFATQPALLAALGQTKSWQEGEHLPMGLSEYHLVAWTFEDWLKEQYFEVLKVLETWCNDEIEFSKARATTYVYELLKEKPEQEENLLRLLINKLGDPVKKIASQASYLIMQLLANHPAMKGVVVSAIDTDFMFKPSQTTHARYYAAVTLNQTALSMNEEAVAIKLIGIYFALFKILLRPGEAKEPKAPPASKSRHQRQRKQAASLPSTEQEDDLREKLVSAVLTGVNRAYPYSGNDHKDFNEHLDTLFQITHSANFNTGIQAMMLIQQLIANTSVSSDRFYRTLYESLLDPRLIGSSKQQLYLNLLHRSLKADLNQKRVKAFAKRILQILCLQEPSFVSAAFFLLKDLEKTFPSIATMLDQPENHEDEVEVFRDVDEDAAVVPAVMMTGTLEGKSYDAYKRAPEHANADGSCLWEILPFVAHFHPSVSVGADHLLDQQALPGKPDLSLHTMIHFLDRFVYKNAKLTSGTKMRGSSIMQPMASEDTKAVLVGSNNTRRLPVNSAEFFAKKDSDVAADDVFFHQYFKTLGKSTTKQIRKVRDEIDEEGNGGSDDEDEVWKAMLNNAPDLEGLRDDDEDDLSDMSGFEEAMDDDETEVLDEDVAGDMEMEHEEGSVDVEPGIFDDSEGEDTADGMDQDSEFEGLNSDTEEKEAKTPSKKTVQKREDRDRKKKLKALPTFASAADYAEMLEDDEDEDLP